VSKVEKRVASERRKNRHWLERLGEPRLEVVGRGRVKNHDNLLDLTDQAEPQSCKSEWGGVTKGQGREGTMKRES
jgi:hypothetical protein